ncbi:hypothetical protein DE146DRAFT_648739, partial [Phaeosphaeria sp. MPI-PUGE-AT-0046c]
MSSRRAYSQRSPGMSLGKDELSLSEGGGLDSAAPVRSVQSKISWKGQAKKNYTDKIGPEESLDRIPGLFLKNGIRRVYDMRSEPFQPASKHLEIVPADKSDHVQDTRKESLDHVPGEGDTTFPQSGKDMMRQSGLLKESGEQNQSGEAQAGKELAKEKVAKPEILRKQAQKAQELEEQALLLAVWQHGAEKAPLPRHLETIRRKYKMAGLEYRSYWRQVAASLLTGAAQVPGAGAKARRILRDLETKKGGRRIVPVDASGKLSSHMRLMSEARSLAEVQWKDDKEQEEPEREDYRPANMQGLFVEKSDHSTNTRTTKVPDVDLLAPTRSALDTREAPKVHATALATDHATTLTAIPEGGRRMTKRQKWRQNKEQAAREARKCSERRAILEKRALRLAEKQIWVANTVRELERHRKIQEISERQANVKVKIKNLLETLAVEEDKQQEAEVARYEAHRLAERLARRRDSLGHVLDDAIVRAGVREDLTDIVPKRVEVDALSNDGAPSELSWSTARKSVPEEDRQERSSISTSQPSSTLAATESTSHKGALNAELGPGEIFIDASLTLTLNADTKTLQRQIELLEGRLGESYPRMDTTPFVVSLSENRNTLRAWLRVLARRFKSRANAADEMSTEKTEVKAVLDQMVRDHDLSNEAAKRMAKRWSEITQKRAGAAYIVDEALDMDEFHAGGMSFLSAEDVNDVDIVKGDIPVEAEEVPLSAQNIELGVETTKSADELGSSTETSRTTIDEELDTIKMSTTAAGHAKLEAKRNTNHAMKGVKSAPNPFITPSRKQNGLIDDFIAKRLYSTSSRPSLGPSLAPNNSAPMTKSDPSPTPPNAKPHLPHLTSSGSAHMVSVSSKAHTIRTAIAVGIVHFSNATPLSLISSASLKKGDVLAVSRIAGIMAAKKCPDLVPLCHPIPLTHVGVELRVMDAAAASTDEEGGGGRAKDMGFGGVSIEAKVQCTGPTGVEMEALTAVMGAALSVVDMCKAVDKFQRVQDVRVVLKEGGKSGVWREEGWRSRVGED